MNDRFLHECFLRIRNQTEFSPVREWLDAEQKKVLMLFSGAKDANQMFAAQGAFNTLQNLKNLIEDSPRVLEKLAQR